MVEAFAADDAPRRRLAATVRQAGRALRHRNFRLFTLGQAISLIGTWMQQVAVGWLVYRLTGSPFLLGLVAFMAQAPTFVLSPIAGVAADRFDKHKLVIATQALMMLQAAILAVLVLTETVAVWHIVLLMGVLGCLSGFDIPARQSYLLELVGSRADLPNAIALNSSVFNAARLVGPAIAGFVVSAAGEGICILLNAVSYVAVLAALMAIRPGARAAPPVTGAMFARIREGFRYAFGFAPIRTILTMVAVVSVVAVPFTVLLPVVATDVLGGGARTLGFLMSATGLGALAGALYLASRKTVRGLGRVIAVSAVIFGGALIAVSLSRSTPLSMAFLAVAGFGMMSQMASSNTVLQTLVDDDKRGRVMSLYSMSYIGMAPLGSLLAGGLAARVGAPLTIAIGGILCIGAALLFGQRLPALREEVRPIYTRLGIIPEVARGIQAVTHETTPRTEVDLPGGAVSEA
jgi:MFS family permease